MKNSADKMEKQVKNAYLDTARRISLVVLSAALMSLNIKTFVRAGGLIPGGFTGITLLTQEIGRRYFHVQIPFSVILYLLNAIPAVICFKIVGKKFALYSCLQILIAGLLTDWMPDLFPGALTFQDALLPSIFGGILGAVAVSLSLHAGATSGGTDFIAIAIAERYRRDTWNFIFAGNCALLAVAGYLFNLEKALYSIIFQFASTMMLKILYRGYQQHTLLIITNSPDEVYRLIREKTQHGATAIRGTGLYNMMERTLLYSAVYADETPALVADIRKLDPRAFINVIKTEQLNGLFYRRPRD